MKPHHDWYLKEWLSTCKKKQADIVRDLEWNKARVSLMASGAQQYTRDAVNDLAAYLHIEPFELLLHPSDAMALRRLRQSALAIAAEQRLPFNGDSLETGERLSPTKKVSPS